MFVDGLEFSKRVDTGNGIRATALLVAVSENESVPVVLESSFGQENNSDDSGQPQVQLCVRCQT